MTMCRCSELVSDKHLRLESEVLHAFLDGPKQLVYSIRAMLGSVILEETHEFIEVCLAIAITIHLCHHIHNM